MKNIGFNRNRRLFVGAVAMMGTLYAAAIGRGALKACGVDEVHFVDLRPLIRIGETYLDEIATSEELRRCIMSCLVTVPCHRRTWPTRSSVSF